MAMLMKRRPPGMLGMLLGAGLVVSVIEMKRGMGIAADESERQHQDTQSEKQPPHRGRVYPGAPNFA
jgi:hypothetical protein